MSSAAIIAIAVAVVVVLGAIALVTLARRSDVRGAGALSGETRKRDDAARRARADAESLAVEPAETVVARRRSRARRPIAAPVPWTPPDPEAIGVSRRHVLQPRHGRPHRRRPRRLRRRQLRRLPVAGGERRLRSARSTSARSTTINDGITTGQRVLLRAIGPVLAHPLSVGRPAQGGGGVLQPPSRRDADYGIVALYQKCPHLGCRVPQCASSQWFECPCHGSQYNQVGEKKAGPAPRGMDRFAISVDASGDVVIDTGTVFTGPAIGTNTTGQEAEGPHCIGGGAGKH